MLTLDPEQKAAVERMAQEPTGAALNASETGTGKTLISVEMVRELDAKTVLIVGPANPGVRASWERTFAIQEIDLPFTNLTAKTRPEFDATNPEPGIWYVSKEFMRIHDSLSNRTAGKANPETDIPWHQTKFDMVIADEAHFATNRSAKTTKVLHRLRNAKFRMALSATPQGSSFAGFWGLCRFLWYDTPKPGTDEDTPRHQRFIIDPSFHRWAATWCEFKTVYTSRKDAYGKPETAKTVIGPKGDNPRAFTESLPCFVSLKAKRRPTHTRRVHVELSKTQRRIHDELVEQALAWLNENEVLTIDYPITKMQRLRQVTLATPRIDDEGTVQFDPRGPSAKADKIRKIREFEPDERIVVYTTSEKFARILADREENAVLWTGPTSKKKRMENLQYFIDTPGALMIATYGAIAEGMDGLQHVCRTEVWADEPYSPVQATQVAGRLNRRGQERDIVRYRLLANDTADIEDLETLLFKKQARSDEL